MEAIPRFRSATELNADGHDANELHRLVQSGTLVRVRRGAYALPDDALTAEDRHRCLVSATMALVGPTLVVSHRSAALLHRLPILGAPPRLVDATHPSVPGGSVRGHLHTHAARIDPLEVTTVAGIPVTSEARTVVDLARSYGQASAIVSGDAALSSGLPLELLKQSLDWSRGRPGVRRARRVVHLLDPRSESPGESLSRLALHSAGLPTPELQYEIHDLRGELLARCDFCWPDRQTAGEFDGRIKYGRLVPPGQRAEDVVFVEKLREDALRDCGWQVVRWTWTDLERPGEIGDRVRRAFARAGTPL